MLDTSGTTVCDDEAKATAFVESIALFDLGPECPGFDDRVAYMRNARGISVLALFRTLLDDPRQAQHARRVFDAAMAASFAQGGVVAIPGAEEALTGFRSSGIQVCLVSEHSRSTVDTMLDVLEWGGLVDFVVSGADVVRTAPHPDAVLTAVLRSGVGAVHEAAVIGDTTHDLVAGSRAGAGLVIGVLGGVHGRVEMERVHHTHVVDSIADVVSACVSDCVPVNAA